MVTESVGQVLRRIRAARGQGGRPLTQREMARRAGLSESAASKLEQQGPNHRPMTDESLEKLRVGLDLSDSEVDDLRRARALEVARPEDLTRQTYAELQELRAAFEALEAAVREMLEQKKTLEYLARQIARRGDT